MCCILHDRVSSTVLVQTDRLLTSDKTQAGAKSDDAVGVSHIDLHPVGL